MDGSESKNQVSKETSVRPWWKKKRWWLLTPPVLFFILGTLETQLIKHLEKQLTHNRPLIINQLEQFKSDKRKGNLTPDAEFDLGFGYTAKFFLRRNFKGDHLHFYYLPPKKNFSILHNWSVGNRNAARSIAYLRHGKILFKEDLERGKL